MLPKSPLFDIFDDDVSKRPRALKFVMIYRAPINLYVFFRVTNPYLDTLVEMLDFFCYGFVSQLSYRIYYFVLKRFYVQTA